MALYMKTKMSKKQLQLLGRPEKGPRCEGAPHGSADLLLRTSETPQTIHGRG